jgi:tRNA A-37 threonylcarbamoyl transferase component Bud32
MYLRDDIKKYFSDSPFIFEQMMALRGECFRHQKGRMTQRIQLGDKTYFIKQHTGVGWKEIIKNILQFRLPVMGAKNEWRAIEKLQSLGVSVPAIAAYGERGKQSFILMEELKPIISLEDLAKQFMTSPPSFIFKCRLIEAVAKIARILHENGLNHRDFYLCHFLLDTSVECGDKLPALALIDLHRVQIRKVVPTRWIIKDLAGLYFSSKDAGLTSSDRYRFIKAYRGKPLRDILSDEKNCWKKVRARGEHLYNSHL